MFADVLLNKTDLVEASKTNEVENRIKKINPLQKLSKQSIAQLLLMKCGLDAFSLDRILEVEPDFLDSDHDHEHDDDVTSVSFTSELLSTR